MVEDFPDPFDLLAESAGKVAADAWTTVMLNLWNCGLWVLRLVLGFVDAMLTPDLSPAGPGAAIYSTTFWLAGALVLVMLMIQLGVTAFRRDGKSLATALVGLAKFVVVWAAWLGYGSVVVSACGGISRALMRSLLKVDSWAAWQPFAELTAEDVTDGVMATVLGMLGLLLWLAAIGHALVMVARAGALLVLAAMTPATAAGLVADAGRPWFWKSLRWFHAAAFTPVLMVLMLGVGVQMTTGVAYGRAGTVQQAVGTALPGVLLILIACFSPLALFKLLAFVDPTTNSGAALRASLAATGGVQGFLSGPGSSTQAGSGDGQRTQVAAGSSRSSGESAADDTTGSRLSQAQSSLLSRLGGPGAAVGGALDVARRAAASATAVGSDLTNQMGVGHSSYQPFHQLPPNQPSGRRQDSDRPERVGPPPGDEPVNPVGSTAPSGGPSETIHQADGADTTAGSPLPTPSHDQPEPPPANRSTSSVGRAVPRPPAGGAGPQASGPAGAGAGAGAGAAGAGAGGAAAGVPIVPV